jgi:hypothetical protein
VWSSVAKKDLVKLQLAQNRAACLALHCDQRADINTMLPVSWLRVEERLTASLVFIRNINDTLPYPTRHATKGLFTVPKSRTNSRKSTVLYRALIAWNFLPSHIDQINSKPGFKNR